MATRKYERMYGLERVKANLNKELKRLKKVSVEGVKYGIEEIHKKALTYTPMEFGDLRKSYKVEVKETDKKVTASITVGDDKAYYAIYVHEILRQNYTTPGTGYKYLERAMFEKSREFINYVAGKFKNGK